MIIGADVSHAAPGSAFPSFAAVTVSMDKICARYVVAVETNGHRVEMIENQTLENMLRPLIQNWAETIGQGTLPQHIYYFRDGVSESRQREVIEQEVANMKRLFQHMGQHNPNYKVNFSTLTH